MPKFLRDAGLLHHPGSDQSIVCFDGRAPLAINPKGVCHTVHRRGRTHRSLQAGCRCLAWLLHRPLAPAIGPFEPARSLGTVVPTWRARAVTDENEEPND